MLNYKCDSLRWHKWNFDWSGSRVWDAPGSRGGPTPPAAWTLTLTYAAGAGIGVTYEHACSINWVVFPFFITPSILKRKMVLPLFASVLYGVWSHYKVYCHRYFIWQSFRWGLLIKVRNEKHALDFIKKFHVQVTLRLKLVDRDCEKFDISPTAGWVVYRWNGRGLLRYDYLWGVHCLHPVCPTPRQRPPPLHVLGRNLSVITWQLGL